MKAGPSLSSFRNFDLGSFSYLQLMSNFLHGWYIEIGSVDLESTVISTFRIWFGKFPEKQCIKVVKDFTLTVFLY